MVTTTHQQGSVTVIALEGKIMGGEDMSVFQRAVEEAAESENKRVVVDLDRVEWMNSTGLGMIISGCARLKNVNGIMKIARPNAKMESLLRINKLERLFEIHPTLEAAIESF
jgi:anti-sigma B factor antagonist